jgi:hypothetical protein
MMKYIRTKDKICELDDDWASFCKDNASNKQSDNPEELCDEFVWVTPEGEHHIKPKTGDGLWCLCCYYKQGHQIYGAIWTDKGLSYAMKMNERGNWELL